MSGDEIIGFVLKAVTGTITALLVLAILSTLLSSPVAIEPFYEEQRVLIHTVTVIPRG